MPEQEPIRDPRVKDEDRSTVSVVGGSASGAQEGILGSIQELQIELAKTGVISDAFKNYILHMALKAAEEAVSSMAPGGVEQEALRQEFISRRFEDKACVKLNARTLEELTEQCFHTKISGRLLGNFFDENFPEPHDALQKLLTGTFDDVIAVREWLWREINENPLPFCDIEKRLSEEP